MSPPESTPEAPLPDRPGLTSSGPTVPLAVAGTFFGVALVLAAFLAFTGAGGAGRWTYAAAFLVTGALAAFVVLRGAAFNRSRT